MASVSAAEDALASDVVARQDQRRLEVSAHMSVHMSAHMSGHVFTHMSAHVSAHMPAHMSTRVSTLDISNVLARRSQHGAAC